MRLNKIIVLLGLIGLSSNAHAASLGLLGGVGYSKLSTTSTRTYTAKAAFGGGAYVGVMLNPLFQIDFGALYMPRKTKYTSSGIDVTNQFNYLQIPVIARLNFMNFFSVGAGVYYAMGMGDISVTATQGSTTTTTNTAYGTAGYKKADYGVLGSVAIYLPLGPMTRFVLDGRYLLGLVDINKDPTTKDKWRDIQALAGVSFGM